MRPSVLLEMTSGRPECDFWASLIVTICLRSRFTACQGGQLFCPFPLSLPLLVACSYSHLSHKDAHSHSLSCASRSSYLSIYLALFHLSLVFLVRSPPLLDPLCCLARSLSLALSLA